MGAVKKTDAIDVVTLEADNQVKDIQIAVLRREIEAQAALLKGLREDIARQTDEVSTLRKTVVDREACIRDLRASEVVRNESLVDLRNGIAARDKMIAGQQEELARMQKVVGSHDAGNLTSDPVMQKAESGAETESIKNLLQKIVRREEKCIKLERKIALRLKRMMKRERRSFVGRAFRWLVAACLPYGVTCAWKRMAYGFGEEKPLFYYHGFCRRLWRIVKFSLPYGLVRIFSIR